MSKFLDSRHLRLIMEVASTESVTRAADRLNVTQSAVSHQLREIEEQLGTPIFVRSGRRMLPTAAGRLIVDAADDVLATIGRVEAKIEQLARHAGGELRVCTHCYTGYSWLPSIVEGLRRRYPAFILQVVPEYTLDPIAALLDAKLDLAIMNDESDDRRLRHRDLFDDEHVAVVPSSHRWASRPFVTPKEIADVVCVLHRERAIEAVLLAEQIPIGGRGRLRQQQLGGITRHTDQQEHDEGHPEQGRDHLEQPATKVGQHAEGSRSASARAARTRAPASPTGRGA